MGVVGVKIWNIGEMILFFYILSSYPAVLTGKCCRDWQSLSPFRNIEHPIQCLKDRHWDISSKYYITYHWLHVINSILYKCKQTILKCILNLKYNAKRNVTNILHIFQEDKSGLSTFSRMVDSNFYLWLQYLASKKNLRKVALPFNTALSIMLM